MATKNDLNTQLINPFQPGYSLTKTLFNKESSSEYTIVRSAAKVSNVVAAVFVSIAETFLNLGKLILNGVIAPINFIHGLFSGEAEPKKWYQEFDAAIAKEEAELAALPEEAYLAKIDLDALAPTTQDQLAAIEKRKAGVVAAEIKKAAMAQIIAEAKKAVADETKAEKAAEVASKAFESKLKIASVVLFGLAGIATMAINYYNSLTSGSSVNATRI